MKRPSLTALRAWERRAHYLRLKAVDINLAIALYLGEGDQTFLPQADRMVDELQELHAILLEKLEAKLAETGKTQ